MSLHLVTGYAGREHVTANDQASWQMATYASGEFVLKRGTMFAAEQQSNNTIVIGSGEASMQGRYIKLNPDTTESITIENGTAGTKRNDLICIRYTRDSVTSIETAEFVVLKGTEAANAVDPVITKGNITDGADEINEMPLYRVRLDGMAIVSIERMFKSLPSLMDNDFALISKEPLLFSNRKCRIDDNRITADSIADVYFTAECAEDASEAYITVDTYDGYLVINAERNPASTLVATIFVRAVV